MVEEYLGDIDDRDWKILRNHVMDLSGDATFVYPTLQAARHHSSMWDPQEWPHCLLVLLTNCSSTCLQVGWYSIPDAIEKIVCCQLREKERRRAGQGQARRK